MAEDKWVAIQGYEWLYELSSAGRVRSLDRTVPVKGDGRHGDFRTFRGKMLRIQLHHADGRLLPRVSLTKDGTTLRFTIARLMAIHFPSEITAIKPMMPDEEWKPIAGFQELYEVSSVGRVRSLNRVLGFDDLGSRTIPGRMLIPTCTRKGYLRVKLSLNGQSRTLIVHRLVASAFVPNPYNLPHVNHLDMNKKNNAATNLEWCTNLHNHRHAWRTDWNKMLGARTKLTSSQVVSIRSLFRSGRPARQLARKYSISTAHVYAIIKRQAWNRVLSS